MRYLIAVADARSFTRAAERCHVSQPPLSRAIAQLEAELGVRLFDRDTHKVALTAAGAVLVEEARRALGLLEAGAEKARQTDTGHGGTLRIGFGGSIVYALLPELVRRFRAAVPSVDIQFRPMAVLRQIDGLRAGDIDIGILRMPVFDEMIQTQPVHSERLVVALPSGHALLASSGPIELGALATSRFVTYEPSRGFQYHADLLSLCRLRDFMPVIAHQAPTTEAVVGIVACGEGVALVPASAERLQMRGVCFRPLANAALPRRLTTVEFALAWRRDQPSAAALQFAACAKSAPTARGGRAPA